MEILAITLSGLALLAAGVLSVLYVQEKKRNEKQRADALVEKAKAYEEELRYKAAVSTELEKLFLRIESLEKGIVPDFEEAKAAVKAADDFNRGLANIMNFDPHEALQRDRNRIQGRGDD